MNLEKSSDFDEFYVFIVGSTSVPQPALIPTNLVVGLGDEFELQCKVYVDRGVAVFMNWSYSSNEVGL